MQVVAVVPAWMLADGEYVGVGVGDRVVVGFALGVTAVLGAPPALSWAQSADQPALTTMRGRTACPAAGEEGRGPIVLRSPRCTAVLFASARVPLDTELAVEGWLTAEPYLWDADGDLARTAPEGRREWTVVRVRAVDEGVHDLDRLPEETGVDHDTAYLLDLSPDP